MGVGCLSSFPSKNTEGSSDDDYGLKPVRSLDIWRQKVITLFFFGQTSLVFVQIKDKMPYLNFKELIFLFHIDCLELFRVCKRPLNS